MSVKSWKPIGPIKNPLTVGLKKNWLLRRSKLQDKEVEVLSDLERIQRRNELDRQMLEKMKKAAEENGDQE